jgi:hypothetical protein
VSLGRHFCVASAGKVASLVDAPQRRRFALCRGCGPKCWFHSHGLRAVFHVRLDLWAARSYGVRARGRAVVRPDDGPQRWCWILLSMVMQLGGDLGSLTVLRASTLCCANDEVALDVDCRRLSGKGARSCCLCEVVF